MDGVKFDETKRQNGRGAPAGKGAGRFAGPDADRVVSSGAGAVRGRDVITPAPGSERWSRRDRSVQAAPSGESGGRRGRRSPVAIGGKTSMCNRICRVGVGGTSGINDETR
ncbi:hypothetical protein TH5_14850 [Thalassospira xianhensis MCCC 1A02616]|uniref:Uncharacterized protein n=1 Tax=Thalassospira xianhensis MCCC 1A02616 TaxID=1177929 RepID=A0A367UDD6_9PROT|nr:hypothetical protein TH5_14850 [Thalassospira xianhensis MCCC 1A02616]